MASRASSSMVARSKSSPRNPRRLPVSNNRRVRLSVNDAIIGEIQDKHHHMSSVVCLASVNIFSFPTLQLQTEPPDAAEKRDALARIFYEGQDGPRKISGLVKATTDTFWRAKVCEPTRAVCFVGPTTWH